MSAARRPSRGPCRRLPRRLARAAAACALALLASACAQGGEEVPLEVAVLKSTGARIAGARRAPPPERPPLTRALLDTLQGAYIEVTIENRDVFAYLTPQLERSDARPGAITVWRTEDDVTVALRAGMVVATRGLRGDLLSASVLAAPGREGPAGQGQRLYVLRGGDFAARRLSMGCAVRDLGAQTIEIVGHRHAVRRLQETCTGGGGTVVNDYWADSRSGQLWQSRQWAGPVTGYLRIRRLRR